MGSEMCIRDRPVSAPLHALLGAADVAADGGKAAAGVFDERADDQIRAHVGRLDGLHKFAVAVVHHDLDVRLDLLAEANQLPNLLHGEAGAGGVALGALDVDELCLIVQRALDGGEVKAAVFAQVDLRIADAVLLERAWAFAKTDDLLKRIVGLAGDSEHLVVRQQVGGQRDGHSFQAHDFDAAIDGKRRGTLGRAYGAIQSRKAGKHYERAHRCERVGFPKLTAEAYSYE